MSAFDWGDTTPSPEVAIEVHIPRDAYHWSTNLTEADVKKIWPCGATGYTKEDQQQLLADVKRFAAQPRREQGAHVIVSETYRAPKSGFPGRLHSPGLQGLVRAIRSNLLSETADMDMNNAQPRCVLWACKQLGVPAPQLEYYVRHRDGPGGMLQRIADETGASRGKAKQLAIMTLTSGAKLRTPSAYLKKLDVEAKEIQAALMARQELQWMLPFCKDANRAGSFMAHLYHFIESKLLLRVYRMLVDELQVAVAALVFDGLNVADKSRHGDQAILDRARAVCEEVAPGIDMVWAWKELDFVLASKDKVPLTDADGAPRELRVPASDTTEAAIEIRRVLTCPPGALYQILRCASDATASEVRRAYLKLARCIHPDKCKCDGAEEALKRVGAAYDELGDAAKRRVYDAKGGDDASPPADPPPADPPPADPPPAALDPRTEPTYEELRTEFSLGLGGKHGKVGSEYIKVDAEGKVVLFDTVHFKARYRHMVYFELKKTGNQLMKVKKAFIERWMSDERMDARYLVDKTRRYCWAEFDMFPKRDKCPADVYNLWPGFAAETMDDEYNTNTRADLLRLLEHVKMLCGGNADQYNFLLDVLAHAVQHPNVKLGIMLCLVGKQGAGKGQLWEIIERLIGPRSCFTTAKPDKDVWGDNNGRMRDAFFVRVTELDKKKFAGCIGEMRTLITDETIRVRSLYCTAANIKSYSRFFLDTNFVDAIPDEHGERRFFIVRVSQDKIGDDAYFGALVAAIRNDNAIRALHDLLLARPIKQMYLGKDIPVGEYQRDLKDSRRTIAEQFLEWVVEDQPLSLGGVPVMELQLTADELYEKYKSWQDDGNEFERSKASITRELRLQSIPGVTQTAPRELVHDPVTGQVVEKQIRRYRLDLVTLRERYSIGVDAPAATPPPAIDCEADIRAWEAGGEAGPSGTSPTPAAAEGCASDDDDDDDDDFDPQCPPSPSATVREYQAWHERNARLHPGASNCKIKGSSSHSERTCPYCSLGDAAKGKKRARVEVGSDDE